MRLYHGCNIGGNCNTVTIAPLTTGPSVNTVFFCIAIATFLLENKHILNVKLHFKLLVLLLNL